MARPQWLAVLKIDSETALNCINKTDVQQEVEEENNCTQKGRSYRLNLKLSLLHFLWAPSRNNKTLYLWSVFFFFLLKRCTLLSEGLKPLGIIKLGSHKRHLSRRLNRGLNILFQDVFQSVFFVCLFSFGFFFSSELANSAPSPTLMPGSHWFLQ